MIPLVIAIVLAIVVLSVRGHRRRAARDRAWLANAKYVEGVVAQCELMPGSDDDYYWWSVVYKVRGIAYQLTGSAEYEPGDVGRKVRIAYNPRLPSDARIVN